MLDITKFITETANDQSLTGSVRIPFYQEPIILSGEKFSADIAIDRKSSPDGKFEGEDYYLICPKIKKQLNVSTRICTFYAFSSKDLGPGLVPVKANIGDKPNFWNISLKQIAENEKGPFTLHRDKETSRYYAVPKTVTGFGDDIEFETMPFQELLEMAFEGKIIDTADHPILKKLIS